MNAAELLKCKQKYRPKSTSKAYLEKQHEYQVTAHYQLDTSTANKIYHQRRGAKRLSAQQTAISQMILKTVPIRPEVATCCLALKLCVPECCKLGPQWYLYAELGFSEVWQPEGHF